jgi:hypothetical protein
MPQTLLYARNQQLKLSDKRLDSAIYNLRTCISSYDNT